MSSAYKPVPGDAVAPSPQYEVAVEYGQDASVQRASSSAADEPLLGKTPNGAGVGFESCASAAYAFFVVFVLFLVYLTNQVDRWILAFNFQRIIDEGVITTAEYGVLSGYGFSVFFVASGIVAGRVADSWSKKWLLVIALALWSFGTYMSSKADNFFGLLWPRASYGAGAGMCNPAAYGLMLDYFPPDKRPVATGIYNSAIYLSGGVTSMLSNSSIGDSLGWRDIFAIFGLGGLAVVVLLAVTVRDPKKGRYDAPKSADAEADSAAAAAEPKNEREMSLLDVMQVIDQSPSTRLVFIAGALRSMAGYAFGTYVPGLFKTNFGLVGIAYGVVSTSAGFSTSFLSGLISQRVSRGSGTSQHQAGLRICVLGTVLSIPFVVTFSFAHQWVSDPDLAQVISFVALFFAYITAEVWGGLMIALLGAQLPGNMKSTGIGLYMFLTTLAGSLGPLVVALFSDADSVSPLAICLTITVCYALAALCWQLAKRTVDRDVRVVEEDLDSLLGQPKTWLTLILCLGVGVLGAVFISLSS